MKKVLGFTLLILVVALAAFFSAKCMTAVSSQGLESVQKVTVANQSIVVPRGDAKRPGPVGQSPKNKTGRVSFDMNF